MPLASLDALRLGNRFARMRDTNTSILFTRERWGRPVWSLHHRCYFDLLSVYCDLYQNLATTCDERDRRREKEKLLTLPVTKQITFWYNNHNL